MSAKKWGAPSPHEMLRSLLSEQLPDYDLSKLTEPQVQALALYQILRKTRHV